MNKGKFSERKETEYPGQLHFHYNREERYANLSSEVANRDDQRRGFFRKRSRPLIILFLDVIFIIILFFVVSPILRRIASSSDFAGYEFKMRAFIFEDSTFVSLQVEAEEDLEPAAVNTVAIRIYLENKEESVEVFDLLPEREGDSRVYRAQLAGGEGNDPVYAEVTIGDDTTRLKTEIIPEQE